MNLTISGFCASASQAMQRLQHWPSVILLRHRFCVLFLREIHGPGDKESGTMLKCQRQMFYYIRIFFIVYVFRER